jgi:hypothetical protein
LNGVIKNNYLYPYGPKTFEQLQKELKRAVYMYNNGKPHSSLNKMSPVQYRMTGSVDFENNSPSYFPKSTENQHQQQNFKTKNNYKILSNSVNVI